MGLWDRMFSDSVVVEVALNPDDRSTLVAGTGGQVTERTDEVGETARSRTLRSHLTGQVGTLVADGFGDRCLEFVTLEVRKIVVCEVLQLDFVRLTFKTCSICGGNYRVSEFPDLADRILERTVAVNHNFDRLAGTFLDESLNAVNDGLAVTREELDGFFGCLVGAEKTVGFVVAAAVYGCGQNIVETENGFGAGSLEKSLGARTGVDVAAENVLGVVQNGVAVVGEDDFDVTAAVPDEFLVVFDIVNAGEGVETVTEEFTVLGLVENIAVRIYAGSVDGVKIDEMVANFVGRVAEHEIDLLETARNPFETHSKTVPAENREDNAGSAFGELGTDVSGDLFNGRVVTASASNDSFRHCDNVTVTDFNIFTCSGSENAVGNNLGDVIPVADDGSANAARYGTDKSFHNRSSFMIE